MTINVMPAAAQPRIEALRDNSTTVDVPVSLLGSGAHYCLEVQGDSMVEAGIHNGDIAIIKSADTAESGEIVVALIDDTEATLKRLRIRSCRAYATRHTYATALINAGVSLQALMALLGHVSTQMSLRYAHLFDHTVRTEYERALDLAKSHIGPLPTTAGQLPIADVTGPGTAQTTRPSARAHAAASAGADDDPVAGAHAVHGGRPVTRRTGVLLHGGEVHPGDHHDRAGGGGEG